MYYARKIDTYSIAKKVIVRHLVISLQVCEKAEPPAECEKIEQVFVKMSNKSVNMNSRFVASPICVGCKYFANILYCVHFSLNTSVNNFVFNLVQKKQNGVT